jgi:hypothetical protein
MLIAALALMLAASPAEDQRAEVERAVFELCPRALAGTLSLGDAAQAQAAGYTVMAPRQTPAGPAPRAMHGEGTSQIVISSSTGPGSTCLVWFGGPENQRLADAVRARAGSAGYRGGALAQLPDGTRHYIFRREGEAAATLILFDANLRGGIEFDPATTVAVMRRWN